MKKLSLLIVCLLQLINYHTLAQNPSVEEQTTDRDSLQIEKITDSLHQLQHSLEQVVISGTMKEVTKSDSPVPVEIYTANFFKANPTASIFDGLQNVNGVRPQLNCNICNTGDIHINGLEGPYTMVMIDGMPIVSGLSTVYGLSGIPQSLIDRVEIVKGPASTLYGSEAVGGLINIITKKTANVPTLSVDAFGTGWGEINTDIAGKFHLREKATSLIGINYFNYDNPVDDNQDGFTDVTLQHRISVFNKWDFHRPHNRIFSLAARYVYEDRWGGQMSWGKKYRGGDELYGESIYTKRWEIFGNYQLPFKETSCFPLAPTPIIKIVYMAISHSMQIKTFFSGNLHGINKLEDTICWPGSPTDTPIMMTTPPRL